MQKQLLADYAPASVLINRKFEVLCFQGPTVNYLEFPSGEPTRDLLALARQGLRTRLRALVSQVIQSGGVGHRSVPRVKRDGHYFPCHVTVKPFGEPKKQSDLLLVIFEDGPEPPPTPTAPRQTIEESSLIRQLENELRATREDLQGTIEELESSNEEMKASNEEMMSMNEELQSVNEELETSKEELQSTNEELVTVNNQLNQKLAELNAANNDISNLLNSTDIPTVFLTTDFRIHRFTPSATKLFHLLATDLGRPIEDVTRKFTNDQLLDDCRTMLETGARRARGPGRERPVLPAAHPALLDGRASRRRGGDHIHRSHRAQAGRRPGQRGAVVRREHRGHRARAPGGSGRLSARAIGQSRRSTGRSSFAPTTS